MKNLPTKAVILGIAVMMVVAALTGAAHAQTQPPCKPLPKDRTITFCYPIDDATVSAFAVLDWGWITDSLPHTAKEYFDGQYLTSPPDIFNGATGRNFDDKIHTFTIAVTDALGTFQKSVSFRQSLQPPCAIPGSDRSLNFCIPSNGEVTTSPLRVAAVAKSSVGVSYLQVWVDGLKYWTEHEAGTANVKMMNNHIYLATGNHSVTMVAKQSDGTSIKKTVKIQIVASP